MSRAGSGACLALALLAACASVAPQEVSPAAGGATPDMGALAAKLADPAPAAPGELADAQPPPPRRPAPRPQPNAPPPEDVSRLVGLSDERIREVLGPAAFVRRDGPAEIWRYASEECFLDLFLYRAAGGLRVDHVDARPRGTERLSASACYQRLIAARRTRAAL